MDFEEISKNEEISWRQRSRIQWLKKGDKNSKYFAKIATAHKRFNTIDTLQVEESLVTELEGIKLAIISFYQKLYKETEVWRPDFNIQGGIGINTEEQEWLQREFEEEEVHDCVQLCARDKAPGPNCFPMSFY